MHRQRLIVFLVVLGFFAGGAAAQVGRATVEVKGMSCPFCAFGVEKRLGAVAGVDRVIVDMKDGSAELTASKGQSIDLAAVPDAVRRAGFTPGRIEVTVRGTVRRTAVGLSKIGVHLVSIEPGRESTEYHRHYYEEECLYVVSGRGTLRIDDQEFDVAKGDFAGFPARGPAHELKNTGDEPLVILVMGQRLNQDVADYPDKNKRLYRNSGR